MRILYTRRNHGNIKQSNPKLYKKGFRLPEENEHLFSLFSLSIQFNRIFNKKFLIETRSFTIFPNLIRTRKYMFCLK